MLYTISPLSGFIYTQYSPHYHLSETLSLQTLQYLALAFRRHRAEDRPMTVPGHNEIEARHTPLERARRQFVRELVGHIFSSQLFPMTRKPTEDGSADPQDAAYYIYSVACEIAERHYPELVEVEDGHKS